MKNIADYVKNNVGPLLGIGVLSATFAGGAVYNKYVGTVDIKQDGVSSIKYIVHSLPRMHDLGISVDGKRVEEVFVGREGVGRLEGNISGVGKGKHILRFVYDHGDDIEERIKEIEIK